MSNGIIPQEGESVSVGINKTGSEVVKFLECRRLSILKPILPQQAFMQDDGIIQMQSDIVNKQIPRQIPGLFLEIPPLSPNFLANPYAAGI